MSMINRIMAKLWSCVIWRKSYYSKKSQNSALFKEKFASFFCAVAYLVVLSMKSCYTSSSKNSMYSCSFVLLLMSLLLYQLTPNNWTPFLHFLSFLFRFGCPLPPLLLSSLSLSSLSIWILTAPVRSNGRLMFPASPILSSPSSSSDA